MTTINDVRKARAECDDGKYGADGKRSWFNWVCRNYLTERAIELSQFGEVPTPFNGTRWNLPTIRWDAKPATFSLELCEKVERDEVVVAGKATTECGSKIVNGLTRSYEALYGMWYRPA